MGQGRREIQAPVEHWAPQDMNEGTFPSPTPIGLQLWFPGPTWDTRTHTQRWPHKPQIHSSWEYCETGESMSYKHTTRCLA